MDLQEIIISSASFPYDAVVYAKEIKGKFLSSSEAVVLELTDEEQCIRTDDIAESKCPGFSYFLEMFLIQEMMHDFKTITPQMSIEQKIDIILHYAEFDA